MPHGAALEYLVSGSDTPTTVFAHGLGGGIPDTRPLGGGVLGRKVFFQFRGHGRSQAPAASLTYLDLAADLRAVADHFQPGPGRGGRRRGRAGHGGAARRGHPAVHA
jgi:pimeloyl-ACP methyl ester carboxylesterase